MIANSQREIPPRRRHRHVAAVLLLVGVGSAPAVTPPTTPVEPRYEVVDAIGATDSVADIAVDPAGLRPALVYYDSTRADLATPSQVPVKLARYDRFSRVITTMGFVNGRTGNNRDLRLAIDTTGRAHALAIEVATIDLGVADDAVVYFGTDGQGAPIREQVDVNNVSQIALAVDVIGEPYVAYIKNGASFGAGTLVVRRRAGGAWQPIALDTTPTNATAPSFAPYPADATFFPMHLAWAETTPTSSAIRHAVVSTQFATTDTVAINALQFSLYQPQVVVDRFGTLDVAYVARASGASTVEVRRRLFNESTWQCIDTGCALPTGPLPDFFGVSPHSYVQGALNFVLGGNSILLRHEGANWVSYPMANLASAQGSALDRSGNVFTVGIDRGTHRDLFLARVGGPWESKGRVPLDPTSLLSHPLDVAADADGHPVVFARRSAGAPDPRGSLWRIGSGSDFTEQPLPGAFTAADASIAVAPDGVVHVAIYDSAQTNLLHAGFTPVGTGGTWVITPVDVIGDVGLSPTMLIGPNGSPMIAYRRRPGTLLLAARGSDGIWVSRTLAMGALEASRPVATASSEGHVLHVSWFDEAAGVLRVSTLKGDALVAPSITTDAVPNTLNRVHGNVHDVAVLGDGGVAIAYNEVIPGQMQMVYRHRDGNGEWFASTAPEPFSADTITRVSLDSALLAPGLARLAWIAGGRLKYGEKHFGIVSWDSEDLGTIHAAAPMQLGTAGPLRILYNDGTGLFALQRLEALFNSTGVSEIYGYSSGNESIAKYCLCYLGFGATAANTVDCPRRGSLAAPVSIPEGLTGGSSSPDVLTAMRALFATTPAGRYYLQLFGEHAPEIIRLTLENPSLLLQRSRTLSDLVPGMTALVESPVQGSQYRLTQDLTGNARAVVQGWRDNGSPALRAAVDNEFARTAFFNQFSGMTFTEWFNAIRVGNATENLFEDGFE